MTTRYQSLRSSISGNLPAAGTRLPGELWVNFPDLQMGLIDASKTAQKLIAVRYFSTTATYAAGDVVAQAGAIYVANGAVPPGAFTAAQWTKVSTAADLAGYLALAGGTMTGPIVSVTGGSINGAAGTARSLFGTTALSKRWELQLGGPSAEGGSNAGSNFNLIAYNDAGAVLSTPMSIARATGAVTFGGSVSIPSLTLTALDNTPIGQTTPAAGSFTALTATSLNGGPLAGQRNRIINGDMRIDQRNNGAGGTATSTYTVDRWQFFAAQAGKGSWGRNLGGGTGPVGFPYILGFSSSSAYTPVGADAFVFYQGIEGDNLSDLAWGTANAQPVTLSFWANSSAITGTFTGAIRNYGGTRSYPFTFSLPTISTWTKVAITIPGDTAGTWVTSGNAGSLFVIFDLGSGATGRAPPNAWVSGNYNGATGSVNVVGTNGAFFYVTGVQLEPGTVATPFERRLYGAELALCQRYYQQYTSTAATGINILGYQGAGISATAQLPMPSMRATPTVTIIGSWPSVNCSGLSFTASAPNLVYLQVTVTALGAYQISSPANGGYSLSAEL